MNTQEFDAFRLDLPRWVPIALLIARREQLPDQPPHIFENGSNLVMAFGDTVLKIFPPIHRPQFLSEFHALNRLHGRLCIAVPEILAVGEQDQWPYLAMRRLPGVTGESVWPQLSEAQKEDVLAQIGRLIVEVQQVPPGELLALDPTWARFIPAQVAGCRARLTRLRFPFLEELDDYLADTSRLIPLDAPPVILTGEYIPENFLLKEEAGNWRLSGLFDFGDVMTGWGEYDLLGPSTFMVSGRPGRLRHLLVGLGVSEPDANATRRWMLLYLLHRYCNPSAQIRIEGWQEKARSLPALEQLLWPLNGQRRR